MSSLSTAQTAGPSAQALPQRRAALTGNFAWTLSGNVVYAACQWIVLMCFAKLGNVEMVGQYSLGLAVTAPVFQFCSLQLRALQVTDARDRYRFAELSAVRSTTSLLAVLIVLGLSLLGHYSVQTALVIFLIGGTKTVESVSDLCQGLFQKHEKMELVARSLMIKGILSVMAVVAVLKLGGNAAWAAAFLVIAWSTVCAGYDIRKAISELGSWRALVPRISFATFRHIFVLTLPLGFVLMVLSLNANLPRYFLEKYSGESSVGIFSALMYCITAGGIVMGAMGQTASPRLAHLYADGQLRAFVELLGKLILFGAITGLLGLLLVKVAGAQILTLFYRPQYAAYLDAFVWLMVAGAISNVSGMLGVGLTAMQGFKPQAWIHFACSLLGIGVSFWLIPSRGILGAAISVVIIGAAALVGFAVQIFVMLRAAHPAQRQVPA